MPLFAFVTFKGPKAARFGVYLLLFPPCFTRGIAVPAGQSAAPREAESLARQGPIRTGTHRDRDPSGQGPFALNPRPRQNPQGKPEHPSGSSSPRYLQTRGVSAPSAGSSSSSSLSSVPDPATAAVALGSQPPAAVLEKLGTWGGSSLGYSLGCPLP